MLNIAEKMNHGSAWMGIGEVCGSKPDHYLVKTEFGAISAMRADGCLIAPENGDLAALFWNGLDEAYILSILKRRSVDSPTILSTPGDAALHIPGGLKLLAENIHVAGVKKVSITSKALNFSCLKVKAGFRDLSCRGYNMLIQVHALKTTAERIETTATRIMERVKRHYRRVEEFEDARIGRMSLWVKDLFSVKSKTASLKSEERIKLVSDKILLG